MSNLTNKINININTNGNSIYLCTCIKDDISEAGSAPKTPQDVTSITSMPLTVQMSTLETPPPGTVAIEEMVDHPLSPTQEQVSDSIVRASFQF